MNILFLGSEEDKPYLQRLKPYVQNATVFLLLTPISTWTEVRLYCEKRNITGVISTSSALLKLLVNCIGEVKSPSIDNYAGSLFEQDGLQVVFVDPLAQLVSIPYGSFLTGRFISKLTSPNNWIDEIPFKWTILDAANISGTYEKFSSAFFISVDIETLKDPLSIRCIGYTAVHITDTGFVTESVVLPIDSMWAVTWMRKFNNLSPAKALQNGKYDWAYLAAYNAPLHNCMYDTATMMHCLYSELPKDLGFLQAFWVRKSMYWKDLAETNDLQEYYRYNALDTWATAQVVIAWINEVPQWALQNYRLEYPLLFPCHLSEMIGVKRDMEVLEKARTEVKGAITTDRDILDRMLGVEGFNSNSPIQMKALLKILGCGDLEGSNEKNLNAASYRHPLNGRILSHVLNLRGNRKLLSTYLRSDDDITKTSPGGNKEYHGRILYSLNPHGTDTGRLASREHHFWCGLQIQNIPRDYSVKQTVVADEGFMFAECDLEQAESRDTAYAAGDERLIAAVTGERDFHSVNASAFFGLSYESIYNQAARKTINKAIRDLAKRVNHGANYLMGASVLLDTMGEKNVRLAQSLLGLNKLWGPLQVCEYLLTQFHKTYPALSGTYYPHVVHSVVTTKKLVGATGWTRFCFANPEKDKRAKNAYVAHVSQSLNAMVLNQAYLDVFYNIALNPKYSQHFKLCAQIHDSILFQFKEGHEYLTQMVKEKMERPVTITGADGKTRTFIVPAASKAGKNGKGAKYWSLTE